MIVPTPTEQAFLTMCQMAGITITRNGLDNRLQGPLRGYTVVFDAAQGAARYLSKWIASDQVAFPIVASTFATLCEERPELREHYDRAKEAWEASQ